MPIGFEVVSIRFFPPLALRSEGRSEGGIARNSAGALEAVRCGTALKQRVSFPKGMSLCSTILIDAGVAREDARDGVYLLEIEFQSLLMLE